jgi:diguanylate cyclase (GGDEF)-like protein/PAS domain S-box-containing protein
MPTNVNVPSILIIEPSATLQHLARRAVSGHDYQVSVAKSYAAGLEALKNNAKSFVAVVLGLPQVAHPKADAVLALLKRPSHRDLPVLVMAHSAEAPAFDWITRRQHAALLLWNDYLDSGACLDKLLAPASAAAVVAAGPVSDAIRVLLVDDSRTVRESYRRLLREQGYEVEIAADARQALAAAHRSVFDIAIIDYFMPGANGDVLCRQLRDDPATADITTAILTGTYLDEVIKDSLAAGAVECMFKNEARELFLARLAAMSRSIRIKKSIEAERIRLASILSSVGDGVYGVNRCGQITFINPAAQTILGFDADEAPIGRSAHRLFHSKHEDGRPNPPETCFLQQAYAAGEALRSWGTVFWHKTGVPVSVECTAFPLQIEGRLEGSVIAFRDVTERRRLEQELLWQANHDPLTRLHNRNFFEKQLEDEVHRLKRSGETSALLYLDLDRFKYINDTAGHAAGDQLLVEISDQLRSRLRDSDLLARLGGDEFAIILRNVTGEGVHAAADGFREILEQYSFVFNDRNYKINGSIGVALMDSETHSPGEVLANADIACHIAKGKGRNQTHRYQPESDEKLAMHHDLGWSARLQEALKENSFVLHFQPIVAMGDLAHQTPVAVGDRLWEQLEATLPATAHHYEVLVRLTDTRGGIILPNAFLPTAERFSLMPQIDVWVIAKAMEQLSQLNHHGQHVTFTINISGHTLDSDSLIPDMKRLLRFYQLDPRALIFEITETSAIANIEAAKRLINELRALGCRFALDDFGSGFSSFYHLKHLPVDFVKIDGQFVQGMATDPIDRAIVTSINDIAHSFGKLTIAEFVEGPEILGLLKQCGVDYAQGYYISPPRQQVSALMWARAHGRVTKNHAPLRG